MTAPDRRDCDDPLCIAAAVWHLQPEGRPIGDGRYSCGYDLNDMCNRLLDEFGGGKVTVWAA